MQKRGFLNGGVAGGGEVIRVMTENFLHLRRQGGIDPLTKILQTIMPGGSTGDATLVYYCLVNQYELGALCR